MDYADLKRLPESHKLRNTPLADIGAELRGNAAPDEVWHPVLSHFPYARSAFNALPLSWVAYADWRAPV